MFELRIIAFRRQPKDKEKTQLYYQKIPKYKQTVCLPFCACVCLELLLFNQDRQNLLTIFVSHESWPNFLLCYFCFQFQYHQKLANCATFTTQFCKQFQNDNSVTNMALKLKQKRLSGQCHLNFKVSFSNCLKFGIKKFCVIGGLTLTWFLTMR